MNAIEVSNGEENQENRSKIFLSVLVIATNQYKSFLKPLIQSIQQYLVPSENVEVIIFTDDKEFLLNNDVKLIERVSIKVVKIPAYTWPEATLLRYETFTKHWSSVSGQIVMYLDSDTLIKNVIETSDFLHESWRNGVALVRHPGYFNRNFLFNILMRFTKQGPWELNKTSKAFVPRSLRKIYVCGGVWMGKRLSIKRLVNELAIAVDDDLKNKKFIAKFHDESHLNRWFSEHGATALDPSWAFAPGYLNLSKLVPKIEVLHKSTEFQEAKS